ncbi:MAG: ribulose-phosphate 3-epimerase [Chlamydiae bacterium]|nr:ribulose-phosphate 3-epimerase [Chlamydiota bacterium]
MKQKSLKIEPSLFAADFGRLAEEAKKIEAAGADAIHFDIMDGHFVRNLSLSPKALAAVNRATDLFLDVHIMVYNPLDYVERLIESGADGITFHFEATEDVEDILSYIRKCGVRAGLAFCPDTSESMIPKYLIKCDLILLMTVHPGFGGQAFLPQVLDKVRFTRHMCDTLNIGASPDIQVDGGVDDKTAPLCVEAGANNLVSGTYLFQGDMASKIRQFKTL